MNGFSRFISQTGDYLQVNGDVVLDDLVKHVWLALLPVAISFVLSLPLGWVVVRFGLLRHAVLTASSALYTIPALALLLLLPGILGTGLLDSTNVVVALTLYSLALLVRTTSDGLASVDAEVIAAATSMGYRPLRRWWSIELPLALPVVLAGVRVAMIANIGNASIAALLGIGGLGQLFTSGVQLGYYAPPIVIGLILTLLLALVADRAIVGLQKLLTPWTRASQGRAG